MAVGFSQHEETQGEAEEGKPDDSNSVDAAKARTVRAFSRLQKNMTLKSTLAKMVNNEAELEKESASSINNEGEENGCGEGAESRAGGNERGISHGDEEAGGETAEEALARTIMEEKEAQLQVLIAQQITTDNGFGDCRNSVAVEMQRAARLIQREWRAHKKRVYWAQISTLLGGEDGQEAFGRNEWGGFTMFNDPFAKPVEPEAELCTLPEYYSGSEYGDLSGEDLPVGDGDDESEEDEKEEEEEEEEETDLEQAEQELEALDYVEVDDAAVRRKAKRKARRHTKRKARMAAEAGDKPETTAYSSPGTTRTSNHGTPSKKKPPACDRPKLTKTRVKYVSFKGQQPSGEALPAVQQLTPFQSLQRAASNIKMSAAACGKAMSSSSPGDEMQPRPPPAGMPKNLNRRKMSIDHPLPNREAKSKLMDWHKDADHSNPKFKSPLARRPLRDAGLPKGISSPPGIKQSITAAEKSEMPKQKAMKQVWDMLDLLVKQTPTVPTVLKPFSVAELNNWTALMKWRFALLTKSVRQLLEVGAVDGKTKECVKAWFSESPLKDIEGLEQEVMAGHGGAKDGDGRLISRIQMASINTQILGFKAWVQSLQDLLVVGHAMKIHGSESNVQAAGQLSVARLTRLETKSTYVLGQYREHRAIDTGVAATAPGMMEPFPPHRPLHGAPSNMPLLPSLKEEQNRKAKTCAANAPLDTKNKQEPINNHQGQHATRQCLPPITNPNRSSLHAVSEPDSDLRVPRANPDKGRRSLDSRHPHQAASRFSEDETDFRLAICGPKGSGTPYQPQVKWTTNKNTNHQRVIKSQYNNRRRASTHH